MIEGRVVLQVLSAAVKSPRHLNIDRNDDRSDDVIRLALAARWPRRTWSSLTERALFLAERAHGFEARSGGAFRVIRTREDLAAHLEAYAADPSRGAGILAIEGAHALGADLSTLDAAFDAGYRMVSPAHFFDTPFGGSAHGVDNGGLTALGRDLVGEMERRGMIVDVAQPRRRRSTTWSRWRRDPSSPPIRASARPPTTPATCPTTSCAGSPRRAGSSGSGSGTRPPAAVTRPRSRARSSTRVGVIGPDHVALGSDWDGAVPVPFDTAGLPALTDALLEAGLDEATIRAVMGENALRLFSETLPPQERMDLRRS